MRTKLTFLLLAILAVTAVAQPEERIADTPALNYDWRPGYVNITEITGGPGLSSTLKPYSTYYIGVTTVNGYRFTRNLQAGLGVGVHRHNEGTILPVYLDARYSFNAREFVPFLAAAGGLGLDFGDLAGRPWLFVNPSAGVRWVVASRTGLSFSAGLMSMYSETIRHSFVSFKLGLELKGK